MDAFRKIVQNLVLNDMSNLLILIFPKRAIFG